MSVAATSSVECACVDPAKVHVLWGHVAHFIRRAMERGGMGSFADVEHDVLFGNAFLWVATEPGVILAAAVTKVTAPGGKRLCTIVACGGHDWGRFGHLIAHLEQYAADEHCAALEICGRPGWVRMLAGYRTVKVVIRKELV
jgi:hypothetical protein